MTVTWVVGRKITWDKIQEKKLFGIRRRRKYISNVHKSWHQWFLYICFFDLLVVMPDINFCCQREHLLTCVFVTRKLCFYVCNNSTSRPIRQANTEISGCWWRRGTWTSGKQRQVWGTKCGLSVKVGRAGREQSDLEWGVFLNNNKARFWEGDFSVIRYGFWMECEF